MCHKNCYLIELAAKQRTVANKCILFKTIFGSLSELAKLGCALNKCLLERKSHFQVSCMIRLRTKINAASNPNLNISF